MADSSATGSLGKGPAPIYLSESRSKTILVRLYFGVVFVTVLSAILYSLIVAARESIPVLFLSTANMLLSSFTGIVVVWWYKKEQLNEEKLWYLLMLGLLLIFQCITADIFVGHAKVKSSVSPSVGPPLEEKPIPLVDPTPSNYHHPTTESTL